jgi:hypothetical protein
MHGETSFPQGERLGAVPLVVGASMEDTGVLQGGSTLVSRCCGWGVCWEASLARSVEVGRIQTQVRGLTT